MTKEQPTYHGVPIPEEFWQFWNSGFEEGPVGFRAGVCLAKGIPQGGDVDLTERDRLGALAEERDRAEQAAWQAEYRKRQGQ
jgi:hypothetical protein